MTIMLLNDYGVAENVRMALIDANYDFRSDSEGKDPDIGSPTLKRYHRILWSKELPNGEIMELRAEKGGYLKWNDFSFGSDTITHSYSKHRNKKAEELQRKVRNAVADYDGYVNAFIKKSYTVGGVIIFPRHQGSMNQDRGTNHLISDRWDLTLECIRRHYVGEDSPLSETIERDRDFYDLFRDFRGYVDFFYLQDCVTPDYKHVIFWQSDTTFEVSNPIPKTAEEYFEWIRHSTEFIDRRAARMLDALKNDPTYHEAPPFFSESDLRMETAQNTDRYPEALDEVVGMLKCDDRIKCSTKGLRAAPSQDGYARYMNIGSLSVGIVYSKNNWRDPGSAETPFWLAIMDSEWKMTNEIRNWILGREPNLISSEWNRIPCIAVIPEIGLSFDETCVKIENDIVLLLTGALNDSTA